MTKVDPNLKKAAVLLRSLDADTAAMMLGQLSAEEATAIRAAMRTLGPIAADDQADVVAELRGAHSPKKSSRHSDVELSLSSSFDNGQPGRTYTAGSATTRPNRFEFLESAPTQALVPYLAREHAQTIAVVLSHLAPQRAAAVLAALPPKAQADTIERLSALGETDPESVTVVERELEAWVAKREGSRASGGRRRDTMAVILAAADATSRGRILSNLKSQNVTPAHQPTSQRRGELRASEKRITRPSVSARTDESVGREPRQTKISAPRAEPSLPRVAFDDLIHLDSRSLAAVLRQVDANVLALALAGSREEMVDRICDQMPKRVARTFRRELRRLGPTRLSDVEAAQHAVARVAARQLSERHRTLATARG
jgi:flagellar motor switch protein FliG